MVTVVLIGFISQFEFLDPGSGRNCVGSRIWKKQAESKNSQATLQLPVRGSLMLFRGCEVSRLGNALHSRQAQGAVRLNTMGLFCVQMRACATFIATMRRLVLFAQCSLWNWLQAAIITRRSIKLLHAPKRVSCKGLNILHTACCGVQMRWVMQSLEWIVRRGGRCCASLTGMTTYGRVIYNECVL